MKYITKVFLFMKRTSSLSERLSVWRFEWETEQQRQIRTQNIITENHDSGNSFLVAYHFNRREFFELFIPS